ncbi:MAG: acyltransferase [Bacteroidetes bacterium]|nr:acyltransferase [Bacteroidota bacterium]
MQEKSENANIYSLDWLRGIASLMVCFFHVKKYIWQTDCPNLLTRIFQEGYLGVYMFFVISGFVIPYSMHAKNYSIQKFWRFVAKRTIRIEPPYVIFVLLLFLWNIILYYWKGWGSFSLFSLKDFLLNITYLVPFFKSKWILIIFWTLAVEFQFYILTGLLYDSLMKNHFIRYALYITLLGLGILIPEKYTTVFNNYIYFLIGFQTFLFYTKQIKRSEYLLSTALSLIFIYFVELKIAVPVVAFTLLAIFFLNYKTKISDFFGKISYSLYLTHGLAGGAVAVFTVTRMLPWFRFSLAIMVSIAFAFIYFLLVEKIFLKWSKKIKYNPSENLPG